MTRDKCVRNDNVKTEVETSRPKEKPTRKRGQSIHHRYYDDEMNKWKEDGHSLYSLNIDQMPNDQHSINRLDTTPDLFQGCLQLYIVHYRVE